MRIYGIDSKKPFITYAQLFVVFSRVKEHSHFFDLDHKINDWFL